MGPHRWLQHVSSVLVESRHALKLRNKNSLLNWFGQLQLLWNQPCVSSISSGQNPISILLLSFGLHQNRLDL